MRSLQRFWHSGCRWLWLSGLIWTADQLSKQWIQQQLAWQESRTLFPGFTLVHVYNPGAAFSLLASQPTWHWLFTVAAVIVCCGLLYDLARSPFTRRHPNLAYALILGGALGNLTDRCLYGAVIDFIDLHIIDWHWPAFNLADSAICLGCSLLLWQNFQKKPPR